MALAIEQKTELPTLPRLLTTKEVAGMLRVTTRTVQNWIEQERIPFVRLPTGQFRIPLQGLLTSLGGSHDLNAELAEGDADSLAAEMQLIDDAAAAG
jgi:excisionase family DNA binding protein